MSMFTRDQLYNKQNVALTKSLFADFGETEDTLLTLNPGSRPYPDLRSLYVKYTIEDPSEATFAEVVFGDLSYWAKLKSTPWMQEQLKDWQHEAAVKRKSMAFEYIVKEIKEDGRNGYQAAKYLIDEPWQPKTKASRAANKKSSAEAASPHIVELKKYIEGRNG